MKDNFLYYQGYKIKVAWRIETGVEERILSEGEKKKKSKIRDWTRIKSYPQTRGNFMKTKN